MLFNGQVGPQTTQDSTQPPIRLGKAGEVEVQELHGRFYEQCYRNNIYTFGLSNTALAANNAIASQQGASSLPVIGLWNPTNSGVNLVVLQGVIVQTTIANSAGNPGGFMWLYSANNSAVTAGSAGINCKTLLSNSQAKAFAVNVALAGLTNNLAVLRACAIGGINAAGASTAVSLGQCNTQDNVDGSIIVPPGGVIAVMNQLSTSTVSVSVGITWEEVPI